MRIYDPRMGRFFSVDPITAKYPELTSCQFAGNSPILNVDIDGLEPGGNAVLLQNKLNGQLGEPFVKTEIKVANNLEVYEQITMRPWAATAANNTRVDFLLRSITTGNYYTVEVKTGLAGETGNQANFIKSVMNGEVAEIITNQPNFVRSTGVGGSGAIRVSGSIRVRVDLAKPGYGLRVESMTVNPNATDTEELAALAALLNKGYTMPLPNTGPVGPSSSGIPNSTTKTPGKVPTNQEPVSDVTPNAG